LAQHYRVSVGAFVDDPADWQYQSKLQALCADIHLENLSPKLGKLRSLSGLLSGEALSLPFYRSASMQQWVDEIIARQGISKVLIYSSQMAQYVLNKPEMTRIADFVDIDSDKWLQYGQSKSWPLSWVYAREGNKLRQFEIDVANRFDGTTFVSRTEAADFRRLSGIGENKVMHVNNGVDTDYFNPELDLPNPYQAAGPVLVFTGAMDYWPNIDAVEWFVLQVLPMLRAQIPTLQFCIAGARPSEPVLALARFSGVMVTGAVPDIRPYIYHAALAVAPLRIARGVQNKVLEAMALGKLVIVSPQAAEGIEAEHGKHFLIADGADACAKAVLAALAQPQTDMGAAARVHMLQCYGWSASLAQFDRLLVASPVPAMS
jgi:sugar transferase (PEP-CTERM/EpsH1 system associated)